MHIHAMGLLPHPAPITNLDMHPRCGPLSAPHTHSSSQSPPPRYVQEYRTKLAFIWPHLTPGQRRGYMAQVLAELPAKGLLAVLLHMQCTVYLLGMAVVLGWMSQTPYLLLTAAAQQQSQGQAVHAEL